MGVLIVHAHPFRCHSPAHLDTVGDTRCAGTHIAVWLSLKSEESNILHCWHHAQALYNKTRSTSSWCTQSVLMFARSSSTSRSLPEPMPSQLVHQKRKQCLNDSLAYAPVCPTAAPTACSSPAACSYIACIKAVAACSKYQELHRCLAYTERMSCQCLRHPQGCVVSRKYSKPRPPPPNPSHNTQCLKVPTPPMTFNIRGPLSAGLHTCIAHVVPPLPGRVALLDQPIISNAREPNPRRSACLPLYHPLLWKFAHQYPAAIQAGHLIPKGLSSALHTCPNCLPPFP